VKREAWHALSEVGAPREGGENAESIRQRASNSEENNDIGSSTWTMDDLFCGAPRRPTHADELGDVEDHVARVAVLPHLAIDRAPDAGSFRVRVCVCV